MVFVATFDPWIDTMPGDDDDLSGVELVLVTGWRIKKP